MSTIKRNANRKAKQGAPSLSEPRPKYTMPATLDTIISTLKAGLEVHLSWYPAWRMDKPMLTNSVSRIARLDGDSFVPREVTK